MAAYYYNHLRRWCTAGGGNCTAVAGSFVDRRDLTNRKKPQEERYLYWYKRYLEKKSPPIWAYHPYNAATEVRSDNYPDTPDKTMTRAMLKEFIDLTKSKSGAGSAIWFTEAGPLYAGTNGNQKSPQCKGKAGDELRVCQWNRGKAELDHLIQLPNESSRIKRFYYYSFRGNQPGPEGPSHDSGLIDPAREGRNVDTRGDTDPSNDVWVYRYSRARQSRPGYCGYGAVSNPVFQLAAEGDVIRACPYNTALPGD
jgi:hypothetical protein